MENVGATGPLLAVADRVARTRIAGGVSPASVDDSGQGMIISMIIRTEGVAWTVRLSVTRRGGWRDWGAVSGQFERQLAAQASARVLAPHIDSESRRGSDHVRITLLMNVHAADVAEALTAAWWAFRKAADDGWDLPSAAAEVGPGQ